MIKSHHVHTKTKVLFLKGTVSTNIHGKEICNGEIHLREVQNLFQQKEGITVSCKDSFITRKPSRINAGGGLQIYWSDIIDLKSGIKLAQCWASMVESR